MEAVKTVVVMGKKINLPAHYTDLTALMIFFEVPIFKVNNLIKSSRLTPVKTFGGRCILGLTIFDFKSCPVGPYKELALSFPVVKDSFVTLPILPLIFDNSYKNFGFFTHLLAMNTRIGINHSKEIFGYPTYNNVINVDFIDKDDILNIDVSEKREFILSINFKKPKYLKTITKKYNTFFYHTKEKKLVNAVMDVSARAGNSYKRGNINIKLGQHKISNIITDLTQGKRPIAAQYYTKALEVLHPPNYL